MQSTSCEMDETQARIKIAGRNINNIRYADDTTLTAERGEKLKSLLMKVNRWGKQWKQWQILFWGAPKSLQMMTAAMKLRHLLLGRKAMTNWDSILKSRDTTLPSKVHPVKAMFFPVVMYRCESWTIKKAKCQRIDAFELWYWRRLLRVPWTSRISNQSN